MPGIRPLECVARATTLLRHLNEFDGVSISELARSTGISRGATNRYIVSLEDQGFVARDSATQTVRVTAKTLSLSSGASHDDWHTAVARPVLVKACHDFGWPLSLGTIRGARLAILENTDCESPLVITPLRENLLVPIVGRSGGHVLLAYKTSALRDQILRIALSRDAHLFTRARLSFRQLMRQLSDIRRRGFAITKVPGVNWATFSVPVGDGSSIEYCLTVRFRPSAVSHQDAAKRFLPNLQATARTLAQ